jgi:hypothetical protein
VTAEISLPVFDRETARARVLLGTVLPLLEVLVRERPFVAQRLARTTGTVQIEARGDRVAARLHFGEGGLRVEQGAGQADVRCVFSDVTALNAFFAGRPALPRVTPAWGLVRARLLLEALRVLVELRVLGTPAPRGHTSMNRAERALRVKLTLELVTRALSQLHREGWEPITRFAAASPERVYQWTVGEHIATYLRVHDGRVKAGRGVYDRRRPFVHFRFADVDAAFAALSAEGLTPKLFGDERVQTLGSPEYARRMGVLVHEVDALLA